MSDTEEDIDDNSGDEDILRNLEVTESPPKTELLSLLECPVCFDLPIPPIRICSQGHIICAACCPKLASCPLCLRKIGQGRNFFAEDFLNMSTMRCKYHRDGCRVEIPGARIRKHMEECDFRPLRCRKCMKKIAYSEMDDHLLKSHNIGPWELTEDGTSIADLQKMRGRRRTRTQLNQQSLTSSWDHVLMVGAILAGIIMVDFYALELDPAAYPNTTTYMLSLLDNIF